MKVNGELKNAQVEAVTNEAARPAAGQDGRVLYDLALGQLIYDNGTTWEALPKQSDTYTKSDLAKKYQTFDVADLDHSGRTWPGAYLTINNLDDNTVYRLSWNINISLTDHSYASAPSDKRQWAKNSIDYQVDGAEDWKNVVHEQYVNLEHEQYDSVSITISGNAIFKTGASANKFVFGISTDYVSTVGFDDADVKVLGSGYSSTSAIEGDRIRSWVTMEELPEYTVTTDWT